ncbi:hypothetical protein HMPREF0183_2236 [Brevibacterium mcbrellneri ATCC 49030]|uniref:Uncharacterized protein n=1 Tax=Brevibacterium mcbrellneri ATCC 49030 TaxID=585530 RepID=D4YQM6_9MICO|nr:hypothetical protein HMPREF0183_2236 [Brevibacterium mcbrellneri ATCC 49030]
MLRESIIGLPRPGETSARQTSTHKTGRVQHIHTAGFVFKG